jgi:glycosyltransferase involved in cell wall biosynthesis
VGAAQKRGGRRRRAMRLVATVTLNPNQLRAHLLPILAIPEVEEVVLVADERPPPLPKVRGVVPSSRERRLLGRAGSKLVRCVHVARELRPAWVLSYNIMPHGVNGFVAGRLAGCRTAYHMIGGDVEWQGGGWASDNSILGRLPRPVPPLERALLGVIRRTDLVCTMGGRGRARLIELGVDPARVVVTPPSVDTERFSPPPSGAPRPYDLVTAGDMLPVKRYEDFVAVVARLREIRPGIRAAIAGEGPLLSELRACASRLGVADSIDFLGRRADIEDVYRGGRVYVVTSRHEGLSVAMTEAMACGLPAVVTDVGELRDLVRDGRNGAVLPVGDVEGMAARIDELLGDEARLAAASAAAREDAVAHSGVARLTEVYRHILLGGAAVAT